MAQALEQNRPVVLPASDTGAIAGLLVESEARDLVTRLHPSALAVFPLRARGRTLGLLTVARDRAGVPFSEADADLLSEIAARAGLAMDNGRLYADQRDLAEQLQRSLLAEPPTPDGLEIAARYVPAAEAAQVGGDWYDAFDCGDGSTVAVIGDVVGHDTAAAAAMGQLRGLVRGIAVGTDAGPAGVLSTVDAAMRTLRVETVATAIVARVTPTSRDGSAGAELTWANAGHPPPAVALPTDGPSGTIENLTDSQMLLGVDPSVARRETTVFLPSGSVALFYTDGLVERRHEVIDNGIGALKELLSRLVAQGTPLEELCDRLLAELLPGEPDDDVALIAVRVRPRTRIDAT